MIKREQFHFGLTIILLAAGMVQACGNEEYKKESKSKLNTKDNDEITETNNCGTI